MAGIRTMDMAAFQAIEVTATEGNKTVAFPVDERGKKEDVEFSHRATVLLIKGIRRRYHKLSTSHRARPQIYKDIYSELTSHGYNYSVERIRRKWNNLLGTYKRLRRDNSPGKPPWEYFDTMSEFLPSDPSFTAASGTQAFKTPIETPSFSMKDSPPHSPPHPSEPSFSDSSPVHESASRLSKDIELGVKRHNLMETYLEQIKEKEVFEIEYKKRKERRERLKIKALNRIGRELHSIAETQCEILKRQEQILSALQS